MSDRLASIGRRVETIGQLRAVVNAMRGIAGTRARQAHALLPAVDSYATTAADAIARAQMLLPATHQSAVRRPAAPPGLILFGAEQGFAGGFPEQALDAAAVEFAASHVFLIGNRSAAITAARGLQPAWTAPLPTQPRALTDTAAALVDALYDYFARAGAVTVSLVFPVWRKGRGAQLIRQSLLPLDTAILPPAAGGQPPIVNLPPATLIEQLAQEYLFAQLCKAAVEAFVAENEARMATMAAARAHIDRTLSALNGEERVVRQDEITAEVVELAIAVRHARV